MRIICIGDSLTYGYGVCSGSCWADILRRELNIEVINKGINGDTLAGILSRSFIDVIGNNPDIVIIMGGSNDFLMGCKLYSIQEKMKLLIKESLKYDITPIIGIQTPIDESIAKIYWSQDADYVTINKVIKEYRRWIVSYCNNNKILYADFYKIFNDKLKFMYPEELYIDGLHPTETGHEIMAKCIIKVIKNHIEFIK